MWISESRLIDLFETHTKDVLEAVEKKQEALIEAKCFEFIKSFFNSEFGNLEQEKGYWRNHYFINDNAKRNTIKKIIEDGLTKAIQNKTHMDQMAFSSSEDFLDTVIERINKKQLNRGK